MAFEQDCFAGACCQLPVVSHAMCRLNNPPATPPNRESYRKYKLSVSRNIFSAQGKQKKVLLFSYTEVGLNAQPKTTTIKNSGKIPLLVREPVW
jgi:hypothetical protein